MILQNSLINREIEFSIFSAMSIRYLRFRDYGFDCVNSRDSGACEICRAEPGNLTCQQNRGILFEQVILHAFYCAIC